ncbi:hypothetical protein WT57_09990 [Burkholderia pseudomultivorans]|uniref:Uncharacterized protein n=1 Tax=Burkholderia pseudomultivorans TaxID=1207504 RepID=A0A132F713_9BURK|nr:hypothetical protein WT57_09990 [Burkholderia pseudomultivorans]
MTDTNTGVCKAPTRARQQARKRTRRGTRRIDPPIIRTRPGAACEADGPNPAARPVFRRCARGC